MPAPVEKTERNERVLALRALGLSFNDIVFKLIEEGYERISAQRVAQIVDKAAK